MKSYQLAVVGRNISYSKSPLIHSTFAKQVNLPLSYLIAEVGNGSFHDKIAELRSKGFTGCNITVPFKEEAYQLASTCSDRAIQAGAANTFVFEPTGTLYADNTDGIGFIKDVTVNLGFTITAKTVLICGAGGAVRGILAPLLACAPAQLIIANRSLEKAQMLANQFSTTHLAITALNYDQLPPYTIDLLIDGTSLKQECVALPPSLRLSANSLVYDLKYDLSAKTPIQLWGLSHGAQQVSDGFGMLVEQAAAAFKLWTGRMPQATPVIAALRA